ncbi:FmdB family zinc ribbon protein [Yaniella halotolerans]|uniref:FmdB family zinc ribbon protein n=1 Tax=Yaniella halotolerans TaxID=225453 RepID=UPI0003B74D2E|nr:zinc ribbon domain-containing protein [Yaniella halotolerans]
MPLYDFKCPEGNVFEAFFTMQNKPDSTPCPQCGKEAASLMPAVGPSQGKSTQMRLLDATKATADQPEVVNSISGTRTAKRQPTAITTNPLHQKLPKP